MNLLTALKAVPVMLAAPIRVRRRSPTPPSGREHYEPTPLADTVEEASLEADDIPVATTPPGGWSEFPAPVLAGCDEPLGAGAPDLRCHPARQRERGPQIG